MSLRDDRTHGGGHAFCEFVLSEDGGPAKLQRGGYTPIYISDNGTAGPRSQ